jgi:Protein of unknown function (DUF3522)
MVSIILQAIFLIGSNLIFLLPSIKAFGRRMFVEGTIFFFMGLVSGIYHTSDVFNVHIIFDYSTLQFDDFYLAFNLIPVGALMVIFSTDKDMPAEDRDRNFKIKSVAWFILSLVTVTLVKQNTGVGVMVLVLGCLSLSFGVVSFVFWRNSIYSIHLDVIDFVMMWIFITIGTICFFVDEIYTSDYWILHSIWHVCAGIGIFFGVETENKTWNIIRCITCGKYCRDPDATCQSVASYLHL